MTTLSAEKRAELRAYVDDLTRAAEHEAVLSRADLLALLDMVEAGGMRPMGWFVRHDPGCEWQFFPGDPDRSVAVRNWERKRAFTDDTTTHTLPTPPAPESGDER